MADKTEKKTPVVKTVNRISKKQLIIATLILLVLALAAAPGYYFYNQYKKTQLMLSNPTKAADEERKGIVESVGKLMLLPGDEVPTLATVSDKSKLGEQPFFAHAENGDKVLIYTKNKKAILYRPSKNMIIEVSPLNINPNAGTQQATESAQLAQPTQAPVRFVIYNGSSVAGLATTVEKSLLAANPQTKIVDKDNAVKKDYKKTLVVDLTGKNAQVAAEIAQGMKGEVGPLPKEEKKPADADILIIAALEKPTPTASATPTTQP